MTAHKDRLVEAIEQRKAKVCVVGLGYVGLPLALRFAEVGFPVVGLDVDEEKVQKIRSNAHPVHASTDPSVLKGVDVVIICVPTPLSKTRDPDLSLVLQASRTAGRYLHAGQLVVLESTTYPGTTRELLLPLFEDKGFKVGRDFYLAYSPERIDPGNKSFNLVNTPKVVAGITPLCEEMVQKLYGQIVSHVVPVSSTDTAEMVKLLENTFRSINIALVNEFAVMCHRLGLDVWEVIGAAASKPFGFMPFYPGPGLGGHCIPVDPHYLSWKLKLLAYKARLIELADEINREMPRFVVEKVVEALNRGNKSVRGSKILILGVAYKKDSDDIRESPALDVMKLLSEKGGEVSYHDPYVPQIAFDSGILRSVPWSTRSLSSSDVVVIVTDHTGFDAQEIVGNSRLVIDTRNFTEAIQSDKIVRL